MKLVKLGSTDIFVSQIGLGTVKFGRNQGVKYPQNFDLPTDENILSLLQCAKELGINLLDTAPAYGTSEERLGKLLQGQRNDWIISTKVGEEFVDGISIYDFSAKQIRASIERSLKHLKTDFLDIVLIHSNGDDKKIIEEDNVFNVLAEMKQSGLIRAYGMSSKTVEGGLLAVGQSDVVMVTYNPLQTDDRCVIAAAQEKNKGVLIKKAFASGHLEKISQRDPVRNALQFVFQEPGVTSVIVGTLNPVHLVQNVKSF